ncbi:hypothetical protein [Streptomyces sp. 5-10]|nr:hypothetical protein [Streptomyces sp. 5-10]MBD3003417.1 hypothetical protein [Streptomyces sp. 5-10]
MVVPPLPRLCPWSDRVVMAGLGTKTTTFSNGKVRGRLITRPTGWPRPRR